MYFGKYRLGRTYSGGGSSNACYPFITSPLIGPHLPTHLPTACTLSHRKHSMQISCQIFLARTNVHHAEVCTTRVSTVNGGWTLALTSSFTPLRALRPRDTGLGALCEKSCKKRMDGRSQSFDRP